MKDICSIQHGGCEGPIGPGGLAKLDKAGRAQDGALPLLFIRSSEAGVISIVGGFATTTETMQYPGLNSVRTSDQGHLGNMSVLCVLGKGVRVTTLCIALIGLRQDQTQRLNLLGGYLPSPMTKLPFGVECVKTQDRCQSVKLLR